MLRNAISFFFGALAAIGTVFAIYYHSYQTFEKVYTDSRKLDTTLKTLKVQEQEIVKKDGIINKLKDDLNIYRESQGEFSKLQDIIRSKDDQIDELKMTNNSLYERKLQLQKELEKCQSYKNINSPQGSKDQSYKKDPLKKYTHRMKRTHVRLHHTNWVFGDICISIEEVKHNKIYGFVGSKEFPSLRMNGVEIGQKLEYKTSFFYEITPTKIGRLRSEDVDFFIIQYNEMRD